MKWLWGVFLIGVFLANLNINKLLNVSGNKLSFDRERINITSPAYRMTVDKYRYDDVAMPYRLRNIFYSNWQLGWLWIDSILKILSPSFWLQVLGFSGMSLFGLGFYQVVHNYSDKYWYLISWLLTVVVSSGLGILIDTKMSIILASPVILFFIYLGLKSRYLKKYLWLWVSLVIIDLILR